MLLQWITSPEGKTASVPKQAYINSWSRQQRPAVDYQPTAELLGFSSPAQAILPSLFSSTFTVPSFPHKQFHTIYIHKLFSQLFRLEHIKTHENLSGHFMKSDNTRVKVWY